MTGLRLRRTDSCDPDFRVLCAQLDRELQQRYGTAQTRYDQHNLITGKQSVIVGYLSDLPVACGCIKELDDTTVEIKRMFVRPEHRRKGFSSAVLVALEEWAGQSGYTAAVLETGKGQPEAISLYRKCGYVTIANYGPYINMSNSICMRKNLSASSAS